MRRWAYSAGVNEPQVDLFFGQPSLLAENHLAYLGRIRVLPVRKEPALQHPHGLCGEGAGASKSGLATGTSNGLMRLARTLHDF